MAAVNANKYADISVALATTLKRIVPGDGVGIVWVQCSADIVLVYDDAVADGAALPANRGYVISAGTNWPIDITGAPRALIASVSGTPTATLLGVPG